jgi:hypothetical protein
MGFRLCVTCQLHPSLGYHAAVLPMLQLSKTLPRGTISKSIGTQWPMHEMHGCCLIGQELQSGHPWKEKLLSLLFFIWMVC